MSYGTLGPKMTFINGTLVPRKDGRRNDIGVEDLVSDWTFPGGLYDQLTYTHLLTFLEDFE